MRRNIKLLFSFVLIALLTLLVACNETNIVSVVDAEINSNNELVFELSDGSFLNVGVVVGDDGTVGTPGEQGLQGAAGVGIKSITINEEGELVVVLTDDTTKNLGVVKGTNGTDGDKGNTGPTGPAGPAGQEGPKGDNGENGLSSFEIYKKYYPGYPGTEKEWIDDLSKGKLGLSVEIELNGGTFSEGYVAVDAAMKGEVIAIEAPTKEGFGFAGWYSDSEYKNPVNLQDALLEDVILYASWGVVGEFSSVGVVGTEGEILFQEYELFANDLKVNLTPENIVRMTLNNEEIAPSGDNLKFNVLSDAGTYEYTVTDVNGNAYTASIVWVKPGLAPAFEVEKLVINETLGLQQDMYELPVTSNEGTFIQLVNPNGLLSNDFTVKAEEGKLVYGFNITNDYKPGTYKFYAFADSAWKIINVERSELDVIFTGWNSIGEYIISLDGLENDRVFLGEQFLADWNKFTGSTLADLSPAAFFAVAKTGVTASTNLSGGWLYKFFNDPAMKDKWGWFLDYMRPYGAGIVHGARQIDAIKGDGTLTNPADNSLYSLYNADHLTYSICNFFNKAHVVGGFTSVDFTGDSKYAVVKDFNNKVKMQYENYLLVDSNKEVIIPEGEVRENFEFKHFIQGETTYLPGSSIPVQTSLVLTPVYEAIKYNVEFYHQETLVSNLTMEYTHLDEVTLPTYGIEGFLILGWYDNADFTGEAITTIAKGTTGSKTFYAKTLETDKVPVNVTYNLFGGKLNSSDMIDSRTSTYVEATRYSTAGDSAGASITVGTARGGLYWYVIALKPTEVAGVYEIIGKGTGYTNTAATLYISYHDSCTSSYKNTLKSIYGSANVVGSLVVIEWLPSSVTGTTSIDMYFMSASEATANVTVNMIIPETMLTPVRVGYTFAGWCDNAELTGTPITEYPGFTAESGVTAITYYAKWTEDSPA